MYDSATKKKANKDEVKHSPKEEINFLKEDFNAIKGEIMKANQKINYFEGMCDSIEGGSTD